MTVGAVLSSLMLLIAVVAATEADTHEETVVDLTESRSKYLERVNAGEGLNLGVLPADVRAIAEQQPIENQAGLLAMFDRFGKNSVMKITEDGKIKFEQIPVYKVQNIQEEIPEKSLEKIRRSKLYSRLTGPEAAKRMQSLWSNEHRITIHQVYHPEQCATLPMDDPSKVGGYLKFQCQEDQIFVDVYETGSDCDEQKFLSKMIWEDSLVKAICAKDASFVELEYETTNNYLDDEHAGVDHSSTFGSCDLSTKDLSTYTQMAEDEGKVIEEALHDAVCVTMAATRWVETTVCNEICSWLGFCRDFCQKAFRQSNYEYQQCGDWDHLEETVKSDMKKAAQSVYNELAVNCGTTTIPTRRNLGWTHQNPDYSWPDCSREERTNHGLATKSGGVGFGIQVAIGPVFLEISAGYVRTADHYRFFYWSDGYGLATTLGAIQGFAEIHLHVPEAGLFMEHSLAQGQGFSGETFGGTANWMLADGDYAGLSVTVSAGDSISPFAVYHITRTHTKPIGDIFCWDIVDMAGFLP